MMPPDRTQLADPMPLRDILAALFDPTAVPNGAAEPMKEEK